MPDFLPNNKAKTSKNKQIKSKGVELDALKMHLPEKQELKKIQKQIQEEAVKMKALDEKMLFNKKQPVYGVTQKHENTKSRKPQLDNRAQQDNNKTKQIKESVASVADHVIPNKSILTQSSDLVDKVFKTKSLFSFFKKSKKQEIKKTKKQKEHEHVELNLISPDIFNVTEKQFWLRFYSFLSSLLGVIFILVLVFLSLKFYQMYLVKEIKSLKIEVNQIENEVYKYQADQDNFIKLSQRAKELKGLLENRKSVITVFSQLEKLTLPEVYYSSVGLSGNELKLSAITNQYKNVGKQLLVFQNNLDFIESVSIPSAHLESNENNNEVKFEITVNLK